MTTRQHLNRHRSAGLFICRSALLLFILGIPGSHLYGISMTVGGAGLALTSVSLFYIILAGRCLHCRRRLRQPFYMSGGSPFERPPVDLQFCPYCGVAVDRVVNT